MTGFDPYRTQTLNAIFLKLPAKSFYQLRSKLESMSRKQCLDFKNFHEKNLAYKISI